MTTLQIIVLSIIQGITEFLPISSSAHLILVNRAMGFADEGLVFDVAAHLGSLVAVIAYFWRDLLAMVSGSMVSDLGPAVSGHRVLLWLVVATLPIVVVGFSFSELIETQLRGSVVIAVATIVFALVLWWADRFQGRGRALDTRGALLIGLAQILALIPGTSRSGITISAGLFLGLTRQGAARFSFLMAIPAVAAAGVFGIAELMSRQTQLDAGDFILAMVVSGLSAFACIAVFLRLIDRIGMTPFVIYRLVLGAVILWLSLL